MSEIVFYSWQSDLPNATNRGFIQQALEEAAFAIASDASVAIEPVVDRDTKGVSGSPDIAATIFSKIATSDVFVADVSIIGRDQNRATPNPNVLIELGFALKAIGYERVILVFNQAFGKVEELPFDLRARRVLTYDMPADNKPRGPERKILGKSLEGAVRTALENRSFQDKPRVIPAVEAIETQALNRVLVLRRDLAEILKKLDERKPRIVSAGGTVDDLIEGLSQSQEPVADFSKIAEITAAIPDSIAALEIYRWFGDLFERYDHPQGFSGHFNNADFDYFKFLGHEIFVIFIAFLLREQRWSVLEQILAEPIPMRYLARADGSASVTWEAASKHLPSLIDESRRRKRMSLHADILNDRHATGELAKIMPMEEFIAADYFMFLLGELPHSTYAGIMMDWRPWSTLYLKNTPRFLQYAVRKKVADQLMRIFRIPDIEEFRRRMLQRAYGLDALFKNGFWFNPIQKEAIDRLGTQ
jgi:hypothetical protein